MVVSLLFQLVPQVSSDVLGCIADRAGAAVRPSPTPTNGLLPSESDRGDRTVGDAQTLARVLLCGHRADSNDLAHLEAGVDEYVDVWTPALHTRSRFELVTALADADDAICDVSVRFTDAASAPRSALLAWLATGRFARPVILDDDHLIEPTGGVIRLAGVTTVSFTASRRADRIRCYYDRVSLIEQMLLPKLLSSSA